MTALMKNKGILATVAIFILAMFLYNIFFKSDRALESSDLSATKIGNDLIKIRAELQRVTLNRALFSTPGYLRLSDFSMSIPPQPTGRPNPFDIIGRN